MAKKSSKGETGSGLLIAFIIFVVTTIFTLFTNLTNLPVAFNYTPSQYFRNIMHLHSDTIIETKKPLKLYKEIDDISKLSSTDVLANLNTGIRMRFKGRKSLDNVTWLAVETFRKNIPLHGYILAEEAIEFPFFGNDNGFPQSNAVQVASDKSIAKINKVLWSSYESTLRSEVKIKEVTGAVPIQKIKESGQFKVITPLSNDTTVSYCDAQNYNQTVQVYNEYLGTNYDTQLLQFDPNYKASKDGIYKSSIIVRFLLHPVTRFAEIVLLFVFLWRVFKTQYVCPKCKSNKISISSKQILGQYYKHQRKDGKPDGRYKDNPLMNNVEALWMCNNCDNKWKENYVVKN